MNKRLPLGVGLLIVGFLVYLWGLALELRLNSLLRGVGLQAISEVGVEAAGFLLMAGGGSLSLAGLVVCILWAGGSGREDMRLLLYRIYTDIKEMRARAEVPPPPGVSPPSPPPKCRFCDVQVPQGTVFCPKCGRCVV